MDKIDAIASSGETYVQQAAILKAKYAPAGRVRKIEAGAGTGRLRSSRARLDQSKTERAQRTVPGEVFFAGICVGLLEIDRGAPAFPENVIFMGVCCA